MAALTSATFPRLRPRFLLTGAFPPPPRSASRGGGSLALTCFEPRPRRLVPASEPQIDDREGVDRELDLARTRLDDRPRPIRDEFWVQNCEVFDDYVWTDGVHVDRDQRDRFQMTPEQVLAAVDAESPLAAANADRTARR